MSDKARSGSNGGPVHAERTRQQLQELDTLLQQMLALPIADQSLGETEAALFARYGQATVEEPAKAQQQPTNGASARSAGPAGPQVKRLQTLPGVSVGRADAAGEVIAAKAPAPIRAEGIPSARCVEAPANVQSGPAAATDAQSRAMSECENVAGPEFDLRGPCRDYDLGPSAALAEGGFDFGSFTQPQPESALHRGLIAVNDAYEATGRVLGPAGKPLTAPATRNLLGWLGILFLLAAAALILGSWLGWTWWAEWNKIANYF